MLAHYLGVAARSIRRAPAAFAINVLTLSLGLVSFLTAFAYVAYWDRADRHFANIDRTYVLTMQHVQRDSPFASLMYQGFSPYVPEQAAEYLRADYPAIEKIARAVPIDWKEMVAAEDRSARLFAVAVDPEFLDLFPLRFTAGDAGTALRSPGSVVLTSDAARKLFGDADAVGRHVILANAIEATVVGVLAAVREPSHLGRSTLATFPFDLLASYDLLDAEHAVTQSPQTRKFMAGLWFRGVNGLTYLRLPERGLTADSLIAQLEGFAARHIPPDALQSGSFGFRVMPVRELLVERDFQHTGLSFGTTLLALGALVLGVACLNYANLATARAARRAGEIGVRKALGAAPRQIVAQSLLEAGLLTAASLATAVVVFLVSGPLIEYLLRVDLAPTLFDGSAIWPFLAAVLVGVTLAAGFYPAAVLARVRPASAIGSSDLRLGSKLFSTLLVAIQFAVASAFLLAVAILWLQNAELERTGLGLSEDPLVVIENPIRITKVDPATLRSELARLPQVKGVTEVSFMPWEATAFTALSDSPDPAGALRRVLTRRVGEDFFAVFGIKLIAGRVLGGEHAEDFPPAPPSSPAATTAEDAGGGATAPQRTTPSPEVNIVAERSFVDVFGLGTPEEAVGKAIYMPPTNGVKVAVTYRVVGVVEDRVFSVRGFDGTHASFYALSRDLGVTVARLERRAITVGLDAIDARWHALAPNVPVTRRFLDDVFNHEFEFYLRLNRLFELLAAMALAISIAGLFGMATLIAARRRREVGVRKVFGATTAQMIGLLLTGFSKPVVIANLAIWPLVFFGARVYVRQFLQPIALTPVPFVASLLVTLAIAWLAVGVQTWRTARRSPAAVLRHE